MSDFYGDLYLTFFDFGQIDRFFAFPSVLSQLYNFVPALFSIAGKIHPIIMNLEMQGRVQTDQNKDLPEFSTVINRGKTIA